MTGKKQIYIVDDAPACRAVRIIKADKNSHLKDQALKAGAIGFLQKPFNDKALVDLISLAF